MGFESGAEFVNDLVTTNPLGTDQKSQGDDHLRKIKETLKTTFPGASVPMRFPTVRAAATSTVNLDEGDQNQLVPIDTSGGGVTVNLPDSDDIWDGFAVEVMKVDLSTNVVTVDANGDDTINGEETISLYNPFQWARFVWSTTASAWFSAIPDGVPIGTPQMSLIDTAPVGYVMLTGENKPVNGVLSRTTYAGLFSVWGTNFGPGDGSTTFGVPVPGGYFPRFVDTDEDVDPNAGGRTSRGDGTGGKVAGSKQDEEFKEHTHSGNTSTNGDHNHTETRYNNNGQFDGGGAAGRVSQQNGNTSTDGDHNHSLNINSTGGDETRPVNMNFHLMVKAF